MKKAAVLAILCGLAAFMAGGCALSPGDDFTTPRDTKQTGTYIVDYNLQTYVPIPVAGEHAIKQVTQRGDLEATVTWKDQDGNELPNLGTFQADTVYTAEIKVTPRAGYLFDPSIDFGYPQGRITAQTDDRGTPTRTLTITFGNSNNASTTFSIQEVVLTDLTDYIIRPVIGSEPVRSTFGNDQYEGSAVSWEPSGTFTASTPYTATVTLNAREGYFFDAPVFTHDDALSSIQYTGGGNSVTLTIGFPATSTRVVDETALSDSNIIYPKIDSTPVTDFAATNSQYTGSTITWYKGTGASGQEITPSTAFKVNNYYTALVTLTAAEGFTFTGAGQFTYASKNTLIPTSTSPVTGDTVTVEISFPELTRVNVSGPW
jgi:hypothetical protein